MVRPEIGDKVRLKTEGHSGQRGLVEQIDGEKLVVRLELSDQKVRVLPELARRG